MRYPSWCKNIIDVTKPPYCADNTGKTDCTDALRRVLNDFLQRERDGMDQSAKELWEMPTTPGGNAYQGFENRKYIFEGHTEINVIYQEVTPPSRIIYFPAGTYLVSDSVTYTIPSIKNIYHAKEFLQMSRGIHFLGEDENKVTIRLADNSRGFEEGAEKAVVEYIHMKKEEQNTELTNVAQMNTFEGITIDCGHGNPGAVGLLFVSSNSGRISHARFIGHGARYGILTSSGVEGVGEDLYFDGFDYGICAPVTSPLCWNRVNMKNIKVAGCLMGSKNILQNVTCDAKMLEFSSKLGACFADGADVDENTDCGYNTLYLRKGENVKVLGRRSPAPFGSGAWKMTQKMPECPKAVRPDFSEWVCVDDFGAVGDGKTDCTKAIQAAMNCGKPVVLFGDGHYLVDGEISIPASVKVVDFMFCDLFVGQHLKQMRDGGAFVIDGDSADTLFLENLYSYEQFHGFMRLIKHAAKRNLVCKDLHTQAASMYFNTVEGSTVWFDNCACTTGTYSLDAILAQEGKKPEYSEVIPYELHGQTVYARNLNPERANLEVLNDHSKVLFYGLKSEGPGTMLKTVNGGLSEVAVISAGIGKTGSPYALFSSEDSTMGLYDFRWGDFAPYLLYDRLVEEKSGGVSREIRVQDVTSETENGGKKLVSEFHTQQ